MGFQFLNILAAGRENQYRVLTECDAENYPIPLKFTAGKISRIIHVQWFISVWVEVIKMDLRERRVSKDLARDSIILDTDGIVNSKYQTKKKNGFQVNDT